MGVDGSEPEVDFSDRLHRLRTRELRSLPAAAQTVLHGGAAERWYFEWFDANHPGSVERHIGVEAFAPRPDDLPANVEWLPRTLGDLGPVADASVDLVFGGQVVEHLWPQDVSGFLLESHRILRPDGHLVLDSPNRRVTEAIGWLHPQHTVEFSVDEIVELVTLAGFEVEAVSGILLGYDEGRHAFLAINDAGDPVRSWEERAGAAHERPEDAFIWWLVARRAERAPRVSELTDRAQECFATFRAARLRRLQTPLVPVRPAQEASYVVAGPDHAGPLLHGPYFPVAAGDWRTRFALRLEYPAAEPCAVVARIDAASDAGETVHASRDVTARELDPGGAWTSAALDLHLPEMTMGLELRAHSVAGVPLAARLAIDFGPRRDAPEPPPADQVHRPEPTTAALAAWLGRRLVAAGRRRARRDSRGG